jgi:hypothetical protein
MRNFNSEEVKELIKDFPLKPRYSSVIITLNSLEEDGNVVLSNNILSDVQYILAKGAMVTDLNVGDKVIINIEKMMVPTRVDNGNSVDTIMQVKVDTIDVGEDTFAFLDDRLVKAKDERLEEVIKVKL